MEQIKLMVNMTAVASGGVSFWGWFTEVLTPVVTVTAGLFSIVWLGLQIYDWVKKNV